MSNLFKRLTALLAAFCALSLAAMGCLGAALPDVYYVSGGAPLDLGGLFSVTVDSSAEAAPASTSEVSVEPVTVKFLGIFPVKKAQLNRTDAPSLIPGGSPIGIKLLTDGVVVVSVGEETKGKRSPAEQAGIRAGDTIISANGEKLTSSNRLAEIISDSHGETVSLVIRRGSKEHTVEISPQYSEAEGVYKAGIWIKDSSAGVGTMTFIDPETGVFGALGHPISDGETKKILPLGSGEIVDVTITGCDKGSPGCPGELIGTFLTGLAAGNIEKNCPKGIFGKINYTSPSRKPLPVAFKTEVKTGEASILTTVDGCVPKEYKVSIEKISLNSGDTKNMVVRVTDPDLLEKTGGIVQGMSGSPIIQDGKIVGAITHVFVSDPRLGYGIFIENMLEEGNVLLNK